jgi:alkylhydroperoxidase family enzyme
MDEDMVAKMLDHRSSDLDERTKVALDLTEDFVTNHAHGIDDAFMKRLREHFTEEQVVELTIAVGIWDSIHKFNNVFDVDPPVSDGQFTVEPPDVPPDMRQHVLGAKPTEEAGE